MRFESQTGFELATGRAATPNPLKRQSLRFVDHRRRKCELGPVGNWWVTLVVGVAPRSQGLSDHLPLHSAATWLALC